MPHSEHSDHGALHPQRDTHTTPPSICVVTLIYPEIVPSVNDLVRLT